MAYGRSAVDFIPLIEDMIVATFESCETVEEAGAVEPPYSRLWYNPIAGKVQSRAALRKEWCPMFEKILSNLAAAATIALFLLEVWRTWKDRDSGRKRADDVEKN